MCRWVAHESAAGATWPWVLWGSLRAFSTRSSSQAAPPGGGASSAATPRSSASSRSAAAAPTPPPCASTAPAPPASPPPPPPPPAWLVARSVSSASAFLRSRGGASAASSARRSAPTPPARKNASWPSPGARANALSANSAFARTSSASSCSARAAREGREGGMRSEGPNEGSRCGDYSAAALRRRCRFAGGARLGVPPRRRAPRSAPAPPRCAPLLRLPRAQQALARAPMRCAAAGGLVRGRRGCAGRLPRQRGPPAPAGPGAPLPRRPRLCR